MLLYKVALLYDNNKALLPFTPFLELLRRWEKERMNWQFVNFVLLMSDVCFFLVYPCLVHSFIHTESAVTEKTQGEIQ